MDTSLADTLVGRVLDGRYRIQERIARGGMATVYRALDTRLDRLVAVKVMHSTLAEDPEFVSKFTREAKSAARLSHPNVVAVFDQGSDGGVVFLVMEYVDGATLRDLIRERGRLSPRQSLDVIAPVLSALDAAHRAGIVHRDIKPENVLISSEGRVKVADFGLARAIAASHLTATTGLLIGTAAYLAPEQIEHGTADARTDLYAAGIVLYELLTGTPPFIGATPMAVIFKHVHESVPPPSLVRPEVSKPLDALVLDATRRDPEERPPSADALLEQLEAVSRTLPAEPLDLTQQTQVLNQHLTTVLRTDPPGGPAKTLVAPPAWPPAPVPKKAASPGRQRKPVSWWRGWRLAVILLVVATLAAAAIGAYLGLSERNGHAPLSATSATTSAAAAPTTGAAATQTPLQNFVGKSQADAAALGQQFNLNVVDRPGAGLRRQSPGWQRGLAAATLHRRAAGRPGQHRDADPQQGSADLPGSGRGARGPDAGAGHRHLAGRPPDPGQAVDGLRPHGPGRFDHQGAQRRQHSPARRFSGRRRGVEGAGAGGRAGRDRQDPYRRVGRPQDRAVHQRHRHLCFQRHGGQRPRRLPDAQGQGHGADLRRRQPHRLQGS